MEFIKKIIQKLAQKSENSLTLLIVLAIFVTINFLSYQFFTRQDLTQGKIYSISPASKNIIGNLDDIVKIKLYFSSNIPNQYIKTKQMVDDILSEYQTYSHGKIEVEHIDPQKDLKNPQRTLRMLGIPALQFNVMQNDTYQVIQGYMGIVVEYGDRHEAIPVVDKVNDLEYKITTDIKKVVGGKLPVVGLVTGYDTLSKDKAFKSAYQKLTDVYQVQDVDLENKDIPADISTLLLVGPKKEISSDALKKLDSFLMSGKSLIVLADGVEHV